MQRIVHFLQKARTTEPSGVLVLIRVSLGVLFFSTGLMKLFVPMLGEAFAEQLREANIPLQSFNLWFVPLVEVSIGLSLILGWLARLSSLLAVVMMIVACYVHIVVEDLDLFPLQPKAPIIPMVAIALSLVIAYKGAGDVSLDHKAGHPL